MRVIKARSFSIKLFFANLSLRIYFRSLKSSRSEYLWQFNNWKRQIFYPIGLDLMSQSNQRLISETIKHLSVNKHHKLFSAGFEGRQKGENIFQFANSLSRDKSIRSLHAFSINFLSNQYKPQHCEDVKRISQRLCACVRALACFMTSSGFKVIYQFLKINICLNAA